MKYLLDTNICIHFLRGKFNLIGKEKARLRKAGIMISDFDLLIGCTSVENDLIMVTENIKEYKRIYDIKIENWVKRI